MKAAYCLYRRVISPARGLFGRATTHRSTAPACGRRVCNEHGSQLVEMAMVFPLFLVVLVGIFSFAFVFYNQLTLTQAVGTGAQYIQQNAPYTSDPCNDAFTRITAAAPSLNSSQIALSLSVNGGAPVKGSSCPSEASAVSGAHGEPVKLLATYPCDFKLLSGTIALFKLTFVSSCQLSAQTTEYVY